MDTSCTIGSIEFEHPIMNAAGWCKNAQHAEELTLSNSSAVVFGSITVLERGGNEGNVFVPPLNSLGLPNHGMVRYQQELPAIVDRVHEAGKPFILSVAGFNLSDFRKLTDLAWSVGADGVELNFGCPNVWEDGSQKSPASFQPDFIYQTLMVVLEPNCGDIFVKLSPYSDPYQLKEVGQVINEIGGVTAVVTSNTFPNALVFDEDGRPTISEGKGLAGFSGPGFMPIALGQVFQFRAALNSEIAVIGVGGIRNGRDVADYMRAGASAVQVGTHLMWPDSPACLTSILIEYTDFLQGKK